MNKIARAAMALAVGASITLIPGQTIHAAAGPPAAPGTVYATTYYRHMQTDSFDFTTSGNEVRASGRLQWYEGFVRVPALPDVPTGIVRGEFDGARVVLQKRGCAYVRIEWQAPTGSVSMPPGATVSGGSTQGEQYRRCGDAGDSMSFSGTAHAKRLLSRAKILIAYSRHTNTPQIGQAIKTLWSHVLP